MFECVSKVSDSTIEQWNFYLSLIEKPIEFGVSNIILADDSIEDISCEIVNGKIFNVISYNLV